VSLALQICELSREGREKEKRRRIHRTQHLIDRRKGEIEGDYSPSFLSF